MGDRVAGTAFVKADGVDVEIKGGWTVDPGGAVREAVVGQNGVHGYKEMPAAPYMEGTVTTARGTRIEDLKGLVNATVTLEAANGTTWVLVGAWQAGELAVNTEEGEYTLRFEGRSCRELA